MTQDSVAIYHPDDYDPSTEDEAMSCDIDALNDDMRAALVRILVGGLSPARSWPYWHKGGKTCPFFAI